MINLLQILLTEFKEKFAASARSLPRNAQFSTIPNKIKVAIGMRRVGKTVFIFQTIRELIAKDKIPFERILFINFEDDRLSPCTQADLVSLLEAFYKLYPDNHDHTCYLFLDEIQNVEAWPLVVRRFFDTRKVQIYLSGSSAKLLSKEIATSLRGRSMSTEIWPLSFSEYLRAHQIEFDSKLMGARTRDILSKQLENYIESGGFPETIKLPSYDRKDLLQSYVELVIMRDIIERYNISNITLIKYLIKTLLKNAGTAFSINKFANDIKSQGITGAKNTVLDYLNYLEDAYLIFSISAYSESIRKNSTVPKKIYAIDTGIINAFSISLNHNHGHLFENLIFIDLKRLGCEIYYYLTTERYEVDFLAIHKDGRKALIQVAWDMSDKVTLDRELRALEAAQSELNIPGKIITATDYIEATFKDNLESFIFD